MPYNMAMVVCNTRSDHRSQIYAENGVPPGEYKGLNNRLSCNGNASWIMMHYPQKNPARHQHLNISSSGHAQVIHKISSKFVCNFVSNAAD